MTVQELYANIGGNYESAKRILPMDKLIAKFIVKFLDDKSAEKLFSAWSGGDGTAIFEGAHALKGVCGNLGLDALGESARIVTEECREGNTPTMGARELDGLVEKMKDDYTRTIEAIRRFSAEQS